MTIALQTISVAGNRDYMIQVPSNFNNKVCFLMHGATGSAAAWVTSGSQTLNIMNLLVAQGYGVIIPNANPAFAIGTPYYKRWQSEFVHSDDLNFIDYIIANLVSITQSTASSVQFFAIGGSSGAIMTTRIALHRPECRGIVMVNGTSAQATLINQNQNTPGTAHYDQTDFVFNSLNIDIKPGHCPQLQISSTIDTLFPLQSKVDYYNALIAKNIDATLTIDPAGEHSWTAWMAPYASNIITWINEH